MPSTTTTTTNETSKTNYDRIEELKQEEFLSDQNRDDIEDFFKDLIAVDDSKIDKERVKKYISQWRQILPHVDFCLKEGGYDNWRDLKLKVKNEIEKKGESDATLRDRVMAMRKFLQYQYPDIPTRPQWVFRLLESEVMNTTHPDKEDRKRQYEFIWPDEILAMCKEAENKRDRLLPLFMYETLARHEEVRNLKVGDVIREETHTKVIVADKKHKRTLNRETVIVQCTHYLREWLENHPRGDDPDAYLFGTLQAAYNPNTGEKVKEAGDRLSKKKLNDTLKKLAEKAGIDKRANCHAFRHSGATYWFNQPGWDIEAVKEKGGWKKTQTVRRYTQKVEELKNERQLSSYGIDDRNDRIKKLDKRKCGNCGQENPPTRKICRCGHALTADVARKRVEKDEVRMIVEGKKPPQAVNPDQMPLDQAI